MLTPHLHGPSTQSGTRRLQRGATLIESLVAMLLFSLGVLAMVTMQGAMVNAQTDAKIRADASYLANELIGKMWSDLKNITTYNGTSCAGQTRCAEWQSKVMRQLPGGAGAVTFDSSTNNVTITIGWSTPAGGAHQYVTHTTIAGN